MAGLGVAAWGFSGSPVHAQSGSTGAHTLFHQQTRDDVAGELHRSVAATGVAPQPYTHEVPWGFGSDTPAFFRDALMQVVGRTYYLKRDNSDGSTSQAWAAGGWIAFRSGLVADMFGIQAALYTSQRLYGPWDQSGSLLLNPEQEPLNVLGQAYVRLKIQDQELRGGRQSIDTPLINPQDNRMVPITFTGAVMTTLADSQRSYDYAFGYIADAKLRDSNDFVSMSDALTGSETVNRGATFGMVKYRPTAGLSTVFMDYYIADFINTGFAQAEYHLQLPGNVPRWTVGANVIDQRSVGADLLTGVPFNTYQASAQVQMTYLGWTSFVAGSVTGSGSQIYSPFGNQPNYTNMQQVAFSNAGEKAIGASLAYEFGHAFKDIGLDGLSAGVWYSQGWDAINPVTNTAIPDRDELNLWLQYRPSEGPLKGLRVKAQYSSLRQAGNVRSDQPEFRFLADYTILVR
ncbi:MAG: OprD family outer membrane porin [Bradyrhizobium sp.]